MANEFHYLWTWDFEASPEALWPLASDTNRFNRDTGLPPMELLGIREGVKRVRWKIPLYPIEWEEEPFDWIYPHHFGILRRFKNGPVAEMRVSVELERASSGGTHLVYHTWMTPANFLGTLAIPLAIGVVAKQRFDSTFRLYARIAERGGLLSDLPGRRKLSAAGRARFGREQTRLVEAGVNASVLERLGEFLDQADDISVQRMRPFALADGWDLPRRATLETFLHATRAGLLDMYWELLCPACRGVTEGHGHLRDVHADSHCNTCNINFNANFDHNVEVIFRPNAVVRPVKVNVEFCVGSPQRQPHVIFSQSVGSLKHVQVIARLDAGRYSLRATDMGGSQAVASEEGGANEANFRLTNFGWPYEEAHLASLPTMNLVNATDETRTFSLERTAWSDQAATGADVITLQTFRDLFASEALRPGEEISVGNVTLLFTDLRESTRLYRQIGDAPAYGRVREHFAALEGAIASQGGAIVKTMGDSVMAAFQRPAEALTAIRAAHNEISRNNKQPLTLKAGLHRGPCIVVNLNDRLDYFGSTVNLAARLPNFSQGGEAVLSASIFNDPEVKAALQDSIRTGAAKPFLDQIKGYDEPMEFWRLTL